MPSKNFLRTSAANDEVVQGESSTSSLMSNEPKFVSTLTVYGFDLESSGNVTCLPVVGHGVLFAVSLPPPPQAASARTARTNGSRVRCAKARSR